MLWSLLEYTIEGPSANGTKQAFKPFALLLRSAFQRQYFIAKIWFINSIEYLESILWKR